MGFQCWNLVVCYVHVYTRSVWQSRTRHLELSMFCEPSSQLPEKLLPIVLQILKLNPFPILSLSSPSCFSFSEFWIILHPEPFKGFCEVTKRHHNVLLLERIKISRFLHHDEDPKDILPCCFVLCIWMLNNCYHTISKMLPFLGFLQCSSLHKSMECGCRMSLWNAFIFQCSVFIPLDSHGHLWSVLGIEMRPFWLENLLDVMLALLLRVVAAGGCLLTVVVCREEFLGWRQSFTFQEIPCGFEADIA